MDELENIKYDGLDEEVINKYDKSLVINKIENSLKGDILLQYKGLKEDGKTITELLILNYNRAEIARIMKKGNRSTITNYIRRYPQIQRIADTVMAIQFLEYVNLIGAKKYKIYYDKLNDLIEMSEDDKIDDRLRFNIIQDLLDRCEPKEIKDNNGAIAKETIETKQVRELFPQPEIHNLPN